ncbi:MAG: hypothetical protein ACR2MX_12950 [Cyclobacteriaceae bacterium]
MTKLPGLDRSEQIQYTTLAILSGVVVGMTALLTHSNSLIFQRFLGELSAPITFLFIAILGFLVLSFLLSKARFFIYKKGCLKELLRFSWLAVLFPIIAILVDWKIVFPVDMNIAFPESLLFYSAIGFIVEILFHVLPFAVLLFSLSLILKSGSKEKLIWICILLVATLEPIYQILSMSAYPTWAICATWINLYLFNLTQLFLFKKYDFISMFIFRLVYYLIWHVIWGHLRLELLF